MFKKQIYISDISELPVSLSEVKYTKDGKSASGKIENHLVAAKKTTGETPSYFIRLFANLPARKEGNAFNSHVMNPTFVAVNEKTFSQYIEYLYSGKEGAWLNVRNDMRDQNII